MEKSAIAAYLHYVGFMMSFAALTVEQFSLKSELTLKESWRIVIADAVYGIAATVVLTTGILRVLYFGQGSDFYTQNPVFWAKITAFVIVGTISLYPTVTFIMWIGTLRTGNPPKLPEAAINRLRRIIQLELLGFLSIPLLASLMARGIGLT